MEQNNLFHTLTLEQHTHQTLKNSLLLHVDLPLEKQVIMRMTAIFHDLGKMYQSIHRPTNTGSTSYHGHEIHSGVLTDLFLIYLELDNYILPVKPLVRYHMRPHFLVKNQTAKAIRKFLKDLSDGGVSWIDLLNQAQADAMAKVRVPGPIEEILYACRIKFVCGIVYYWC